MQSGTGQSGMQSRMGQSGMQSRMGQSAMQYMGGVNITGSSALAGSLLFLLGVFTFFAGIAGFARANFYNVGTTYPYHLSSYGWGWLYVIGGVVLALTGLALFGQQSATWARPVGLGLAVLSAIANFFFLPFFPLWAFLMLATALFAIGALVRDTDAETQARQQAQRQGAQQYRMSRYGQPQTGMGTQQQTGMGTQQQTAMATEQQERASAYTGAQSGQRMPANTGARPETGGRQWAPSDLKDSASRLGDKVQEHAQAGARGGAPSAHEVQSGRNMADDAAERARQQQQQGQNQPGR
jgi:hypothetical protein